MAERSVTSSSLRAALAWLATFALAHRLLGGPRWLVAFAIASIVVAALGWRGLLRPLGALSGLVVAVAVPTAGAVVEPSLYSCIAQVVSREEAQWLEETAKEHFLLLPCSRTTTGRSPRPPCPVEVPRWQSEVGNGRR